MQLTIYCVNIFNINIFINFHCATIPSHTENMLEVIFILM